MSFVSLVEHERPRVMLLDFAQKDVEKFRQAGYEAKRGSTGVVANDRDLFFFPYPAQDVEVVFAQIQNGSFMPTGSRQPQENSAESSPFFRDLFREVWSRAGWLVLFISQGCTVEELASVGIEHLGVLPQGKNFDPASLIHSYDMEREQEVNAYGRFISRSAPIKFPDPGFPRFTGNTLNISEDAVETEILRRYIQSASQSVLSCMPLDLDSRFQYFVMFGESVTTFPLAWDNSTSRSIVALKALRRVFSGQYGTESIYNNGGILLLPNFGLNNVNVALALMQEVIPHVSPHLFDQPQHSWLVQYQPALVTQLEKQKEEAIKQVQQQIEEIDQRADDLRQKFAWHPGLLVHTGDEFADDVANALRYIGFEVDEVDNNIAPGERKKEDLHVREISTDYFAIGEAKTTGKGRGAQEDFITRTQTHQSRYARDHKQPPPLALLIVNYAIDLEPLHRAGRFFSEDLRERLSDNEITAVDSVALWQVCQAVMSKQMTHEQARAILKSGEAFVRIGDA